MLSARHTRYSIARSSRHLSGKRYQVTWNKIATKCCLGELKLKKKVNPGFFSGIVGNENGYCCLVESPITHNVRSLPAQRMKGIRAGGDI